MEEALLAVGTISIPIYKAYWTGTDQTSAEARQVYRKLLSELYQIHGKSASEADAIAARLGNLFTALAPAASNPED